MYNLTFEFLPLTVTLGNFLLLLLIAGSTYLSLSSTKFTVKGTFTNAFRVRTGTFSQMVCGICIMLCLYWAAGIFSSGLNLFVIALLTMMVLSMISSYNLNSEIHMNPHIKHKLKAPEGQLFVIMPYSSKLICITFSLMLYYLSGAFTPDNELPLKIQSVEQPATPTPSTTHLQQHPQSVEV